MGDSLLDHFSDLARENPRTTNFLFIVGEQNRNSWFFKVMES